jgi:hypothetical protein
MVKGKLESPSIDISFKSGNEAQAFIPLHKVTAQLGCDSMKNSKISTCMATFIDLLLKKKLYFLKQLTCCPKIMKMCNGLFCLLSIYLKIHKT